MARTSKAAARLSQQFRERDVEKIYWAVVEGVIDPPAGTLVDFLRKDERHRRMHIAQPNAAGAQRAELAYRVLLAGGSTRAQATHEESLPFTLPAQLSLLEIRPLTGRKHQIRVQLSQAGFPIVGDRKYGSTRAFPAGIALHSRRLVVTHPVSKMQVEIEASLPKSWQRL
jgi:23S rRNA pseudouridine1911/1915/1917 synthase